MTGVLFPAKPGTFLFAITSRLVLGLTQHPIQCVPEAPSSGVKRPEPKVDHSHPSNAEVNA